MSNEISALLTSTAKKSNISDKQNETAENDKNAFAQETNKIADGITILGPEPESCKKENENLSENIQTPLMVDFPFQKTEAINWMIQSVQLNENDIHEHLKQATEKDLQEILKEMVETNSYLSKENEVYEFILNEDEALQNSINSAKEDEDLSALETFTLSYPTKCYFAKKKLEHVEKELELKKEGYADELQNLNFELQSLNMSLKDLKKCKEKFDKDIRIGGRHPVTKKIILQKVEKYFDDSIRTKMALVNRYKIQLQGDTMERSKILSQIKAQEKRLASLNMAEFEEARFEHIKSCRQLALFKEQLAKFRGKFSPLLQSMAEMKKALEKEQNEMERMKNAVSKLEHLKSVMFTEKARNDQKVEELKASMRKIKLDPRRHNLPEVIDYAAAKRENAILMKNINKWQKKVEVAQQQKCLYLNALSEKKKL